MRSNFMYASATIVQERAEQHVDSSRVGELHALRKGRGIREVECARAPADVLLPRVAARLATPAYIVSMLKRATCEHRKAMTYQPVLWEESSSQSV